MSDCILLAACGSDESLPTDPECIYFFEFSEFYFFFPPSFLNK